MSLDTVSAGTGAIPQINENFDSVTPASIYGRRASTTAGLTWGYYGGRAFANTIANATIALTASTTNYVVASRANGVVTVATNTTNWNDTANYFRCFLIVTGASTITTWTDYREFTPAPSGTVQTVQAIPIACSDETTALTTGTKVVFRVPLAMTSVSVKGSLTTAQTSGSLLRFDVQEGGVSIFSTKPTFNNSSKTTVGATTPAVVSDNALAADAEITILIDQIGDGTAKGLKVYIIGTV